jgi:hypothetical protein
VPVAELSIFVDEAGVFGPDSDYHVVALVLHPQGNDITPMLDRLAEELRTGVDGLEPDRAIHTGPAIRGENEYRGVPVEARKLEFRRDRRCTCFNRR